MPEKKLSRREREKQRQRQDMLAAAQALLGHLEYRSSSFET